MSRPADRSGPPEVCNPSPLDGGSADAGDGGGDAGPPPKTSSGCGCSSAAAPGADAGVAIALALLRYGAAKFGETATPRNAVFVGAVKTAVPVGVLTPSSTNTTSGCYPNPPPCSPSA